MDVTRRKILPKLEHWFFKGKALVITGARQVGKTTLIGHMLHDRDDVLWLNADDALMRDRLREVTIANVKSVVGDYKVVVIDEVQRVGNAGLLLKLMVDNFKDVQFIATGSSALEISETVFEPLTGRHILFHLYPFSLAELYAGRSPFEVEQQLPFHLVHGFYPDVTKNPADAETLLKALCDQYLYKDVLVWKDIRKPELLDKLLKLLAYQICSEVSLNELAVHLKVKSETVESYIDLLEKAFVIHRLHAYSTNERKEVTKMTKVYFWDNGIRNALIDNLDPVMSRNDVGLLWENMMVSDRRKMNAWTGSNARSYFWRNYNQSEVDYVELQGRKLSAFEMKWNVQKAHRITRAFTNSYPDAETAIITPRDFTSFSGM
jgi:predicted AAA+ superfamily ATPase